MEITQKAWMEYVTKMEKLNYKASLEMRIWLMKNGTGNRSAMLNFAKALTDKYGEAVGSLACEFYDAFVQMEGLLLRPAEPAPTATFGEVAKNVNGVAKISEELISPTVGKMAKQVGADTIIKNAIRDGAEFAWIPSGDTCPYCLMMASRGWTKASKDSLDGGHAKHIHPNCNCQYAVRHNKTTTVEGYNPDKYKKIWENAEGSKLKEKLKNIDWLKRNGKLELW